jgi:hypothetical protein
MIGAIQGRADGSTGDPFRRSSATHPPGAPNGGEVAWHREPNVKFNDSSPSRLADDKNEDQGTEEASRQPPVQQESTVAHRREKHHLMLRPQGIPRIIWDMITMIFLAYLLISMPYRMGFEVDAEGWEAWFERSIDFFFLADVLVNFRTGFVNEFGKEVLDGRIVAKMYLQTWFTIDLLSSIPFDLFFAAMSGNALISDSVFLFSQTFVYY